MRIYFDLQQYEDRKLDYNQEDVLTICGVPKCCFDGDYVIIGSKAVHQEDFHWFLSDAVETAKRRGVALENIVITENDLGDYV